MALRNPLRLQRLADRVYRLIIIRVKRIEVFDIARLMELAAFGNHALHEPDADIAADIARDIHQGRSLIIVFRP